MPVIPSYGAVEDSFKDIFKSRFITETRAGSKYGGELASALKLYLDVPHVFMTPNCMTALMLAWKALRIKAEKEYDAGYNAKEVIVPSYTYAATANAIRWAGLEPVFCDVDEHCTIDAAKAEELVTDKTFGICNVDLYGNPGPIKELGEIVQKHNIFLVHDSAQGFGVGYHMRAVGGFNHVSCFSMSATKILTAGEGGFVTTPLDDVAQTIEALRYQGLGDIGRSSCEYSGLTGRFTEFQAVVAMAGLPLVEDEIKKRIRLAAFYKEQLGDLVGYMKERDRCFTTYFAFPIFVDPEKKEKVWQALENASIESKKFYFSPALHQMKAFENCKKGDLTRTEELSSKVLTLPMHGQLKNEDVLEVCGIVKEALK